MINLEKLQEILNDSLYNPEEVPDNKPPSDAMIGDGIARRFAFHPLRLESHSDEIIDMLRMMDPAFMQSGGQGMSFLNMPMDKDGNQWGEQVHAGDLIALGNALGLVEIPVPRDMWNILPGGVPYIVINDALFPEDSKEATG